jgi:hypothetical protein
MMAMAEAVIARFGGRGVGLAGREAANLTEREAAALARAEAAALAEGEAARLAGRRAAEAAEREGAEAVERRAARSAEENAAKDAEQQAATSEGDAAREAVERPLAVAEAVAIEAGMQARGASEAALIAALDAGVKPRFTWVKGFQVEHGGLADMVYMIGSKIPLLPYSQRLADLEARIEALEGTEAPSADLIGQLDALDPHAPDPAQARALEERVAFWEREQPGRGAESLGEVTGESEAARRATLGEKAEQLEANRVQGSLGELRVEEEILSGKVIPELGSPATFRGSQVEISTSAGPRVVDHVVQLPNGELVALEVKTGSASRGLEQLEKDHALELQGGIVIRSATGGMSGPIGPIRTVVIRR